MIHRPSATTGGACTHAGVLSPGSLWTYPKRRCFCSITPGEGFICFPSWQAHGKPVGINASLIQSPTLSEALKCHQSTDHLRLISKFTAYPYWVEGLYAGCSQDEENE